MKWRNIVSGLFLILLFDMLFVHRIDAEAMGLKNKLDEMVGSEKPSSEGQDKVSDETTQATIGVSSRIVITLFPLFSVMWIWALLIC